MKKQSKTTKINQALAILFISFILQSVYAKSILKIGAIQYPPYFIFDHQENATGIAVKLIEEKLGANYELQWKKIPLARGVYALNNNMIQVYTGFIKTEQTSREIDYSTKPYYTVQPMLCSPKDFEDNTSQSVLYPRGSSILKEFQDKKYKIIEFEYGTNYIQKAVKMLYHKRADSFLGPEKNSVLEYIKGDKNLKCREVGSEINIHLTYKKGSKTAEQIDPLL